MPAPAMAANIAADPVRMAAAADLAGLALVDMLFRHATVTGEPNSPALNEAMKFMRFVAFVAGAGALVAGAPGIDLASIAVHGSAGPDLGTGGPAASTPALDEPYSAPAPR